LIDGLFAIALRRLTGFRCPGCDVATELGLKQCCLHQECWNSMAELGIAGAPSQQRPRSQTAAGFSNGFWAAAARSCEIERDP